MQLRTAYISAAVAGLAAVTVAVVLILGLGPSQTHRPLATLSSGPAPTSLGTSGPGSASAPATLLPTLSASTSPSVSASASPGESASSVSATPPVADTGSVLTPRQAAGAVAAYISGNNRANARLDFALQDKHERDVVALVDDTYFRFARTSGNVSIPSFTAVGLRVIVPRQAAYPATFLAILKRSISAKASDETLLWLFRRDSKSDSWRVSSAAAVPATVALPVFAVDADGYTPRLAERAMAVSPDRVRVAWLAADRAGAQHRAPSTAWARSAFLTAVISPSFADGAIDTRSSFAATHYAPTCLATAGGALCLLSVAVTDHLQEVPGRHWNVNDNSDSAYDGGIPVGHYATLTLRNIEQVAVEVTGAPANPTLRLVGRQTNTLSGTGVPR